VVVHEALPPQKDRDAPKPVPDPYGSYPVHPHAQKCIAAPLRPVIENAFVQQYQTDATVYGNIVFHPDVDDLLTSKTNSF